MGAGFSTVVPMQSPAPPRMVKTISKHDLQVAPLTQKESLKVLNTYSKCLMARKKAGYQMFTAEKCFYFKGLSMQLQQLMSGSV